MQRSISVSGLLLASISAIIGSGWLFSSFYTATIAGPAAILAWVIGGVAMIVVAFIFAELCSMLPISGSSARIPQFTHGSMVSFIFAWIIWLSYLALMAAEVQAVIQYISFYFAGLTKPSGGLTSSGYITATFLMLGIAALNTYSLRWLIRCNSILTVLKLIIPIFISIIVLTALFSVHKVIHPHGSEFMPYGWHGVLSALSTGGIVFAFNGFKQAAEMAGEAKRPQLSVPLAIIGSVFICMILFILLQCVFLSSLDGANLSLGWNNIHLSNNNSPLAAVLQQDGFKWLLPLLYIGAVIAPLAAALMYCGSAARSLYGMSRNGYLPGFFQVLSAGGNPVITIGVNFLFGMCLFAPLPGWKEIVDFLTSLLAVTYGIGPLCLLALRRQLPNQPRPLRLPFANIWATFAFYICTMLAYWSGWSILSKMLFALALGIAILVIYRMTTRQGHNIQFNWRASIWMWVYLFGLLIISYLGNYGGGLNILTMPLDFIVIAVLCIVCAILAVKFRLPDEQTQAYVHELKLSSTHTAL